MSVSALAEVWGRQAKSEVPAARVLRVPEHDRRYPWTRISRFSMGAVSLRLEVVPPGFA